MQTTLAIRITLAALTLPLLLDGSAFAQGKGNGNGKGGGGGGGGGGGQPEIAVIRRKIKMFGKVSSTFSLVVMDADGSNETVVLEEYSEILAKGKELWDPTWSPDGQRLALQIVDWDGGPSGIFTVNLDGTGLSLVAEGGVEPAWSPDGSSIAYYHHGDQELAIVGADGTGNTLVTGNPDVQETQPTWSPDGRYLAYIAYSGSASDGTEKYEVHVLDLFTGDVINVTEGSPISGMCLYGVDWANQSDGLVLSATPGCDGFNHEFDVWHVDLGSGLATNLSNTPQDDYLWSELTPTWSSDDSRIAFIRGLDLYAMNADGSEVTLLAPGGDGKFITQHWDPDWKR